MRQRWLKTSSAARSVLFVLVLLLPTLASGQQPAAAEDTGYPSTGPLSGYMDFHFNKADGEDGVLDFNRFVLHCTDRPARNDDVPCRGLPNKNDLRHLKTP